MEYLLFCDKIIKTSNIESSTRTALEQKMMPIKDKQFRTIKRKHDLINFVKEICKLIFFS